MEHTEELSHPKDEKDGEFSHQLPSVISLKAVPRDVTSLALPACLAPASPVVREALGLRDADIGNRKLPACIGSLSAKRI